MIVHKKLPPYDVWRLLIEDTHGDDGSAPPEKERGLIYTKLILSGKMDLFVYSPEIVLVLTKVSNWIVRLDTVTKPNTSPYSLIKAYASMIDYLKTTEYIKMETRTRNKKLIEVMSRKFPGFSLEGTHMNCDDKNTIEYSGGLIIKEAVCL
jgi:hypothetical protein